MYHGSLGKDEHQYKDQHEDTDEHEDEDDDEDPQKPKPTESKKTSKEKQLTPESFDDNVVDAKLQSSKTKENALKNLESMMGSGNYKNMGYSINKIAGDQKALENMIEKMEPIMDKVGGMLDKFENSKLAGLLPKFMSTTNKEEGN